LMPSAWYRHSWLLCMTIDAANDAMVAGSWRELRKVSFDNEVKAAAPYLPHALTEFAKFDLNPPRKRPLL
jgi:hypothetical protein